jgi:hypothetical protein
MSFVIDASVVIAWAFKEQHATAEHALARIQAEPAIGPALWWYELRDVLVLGERQGNCPLSARYLALGDYDGFVA